MHHLLSMSNAIRRLWDGDFCSLYHVIRKPCIRVWHRIMTLYHVIHKPCIRIAFIVETSTHLRFKYALNIIAILLKQTTLIINFPAHAPIVSFHYAPSFVISYNCAVLSPRTALPKHIILKTLGTWTNLEDSDNGLLFALTYEGRQLSTSNIYFSVNALVYILTITIETKLYSLCKVLLRVVED